MKKSKDNHQKENQTMKNIDVLKTLSKVPYSYIHCDTTEEKTILWNLFDELGYINHDNPNHSLQNFLYYNNYSMMEAPANVHTWRARPELERQDCVIFSDVFSLAETECIAMTQEQAKEILASLPSLYNLEDFEKEAIRIVLKSKEHHVEPLKAVKVLPYHLTEDTLAKYIHPEMNTAGIIHAPLLTMPRESCIMFGHNVTPVIEIFATSPYEDINTDNDELVPQDLLDLLNWAFENNISYIELEPEDLGCYQDWDEIKEKAAITGLPLYNISEADF